MLPLLAYVLVQVMLLCGADVLASLTVPGVWEAPDAILEGYGIACVVREGTDIEALMQHELLSRCVRMLHLCVWLCVVVYTWCVRMLHFCEWLCTLGACVCCIFVCGCVHLVRAYVAFLCVVVYTWCVRMLHFCVWLCVVVYTWCVRAPTLKH